MLSIYSNEFLKLLTEMVKDKKMYYIYNLLHFILKKVRNTMRNAIEDMRANI